MQHVQVRICEEGALRNQRYAFTHRYTVVSELMQNARRAGASEITIEYDPGTRVLCVADDGIGIEDFQRLLTLHASGWSEPTLSEERPFGVGFSKCLYAADRCIVRSRGQRIDFATDAALAGERIELVDEAPSVGTTVTLIGVDLPDLQWRIFALCQGFAIPVRFNGLEVPRPMALGALPFVACPIGQVYLAGTADGGYALQTRVFLQGFCVMGPAYSAGTQVNVVHLDAARFLARLPDRDKLIDEEEQRARIDACLGEQWRAVLLEAKATMSAEAFVATYFDAARAWRHVDLFNDVAVLPSALCERIVGYPIQEGHGDCDYLRPVAPCLTRAQVEEGARTLVDLQRVREDNSAHWMFARARGEIVFAAGALHREHWVQPHVRAREAAPVALSILGEACRAPLEGRRVCAMVVLCAGYALTIGGERVEIGDAGLYHDGLIVIPEHEHSGEAVRQAADFIDENDRFMEADLEADREALAELIQRLRCADPRAALESLVRGLTFEKYPSLQGRTFRVSVGACRDRHGVELLS